MAVSLLRLPIYLDRNRHGGEVRDLHLLTKHGGYRHGGVIDPIAVAADNIGKETFCSSFSFPDFCSSI